LGGVDAEGNEEPIEAGMLSKQIEKAQRKVEEQNFLIRKRVLEYDDVMNEQRRVIYAYRDEVLAGQSIGEEAREQVAKVLGDSVARYTEGNITEDWDFDGLFTALSQFLAIEPITRNLDRETIDRESLTELVTATAQERYAARESELGEELMGALERFLLLQIIDERWREHLHDMDYLREGIHLRGFAQIDPLVAYKNEAFNLFGDLMQSIWTDFARMIFNAQVSVDAQNGAAAQQTFAAPGSPTRAGRVSYSGGTSAMGAGAIAAAAGQPNAPNNDEAPPQIQQRVVDGEHQVGRNDPCWCGSGKKFKKCHGS
jgi:preprotein translocase subunit SecA